MPNLWPQSRGAGAKLQVWCTRMNQAQIELVRGLQDRMNIIIANYRKDPMYAPPEWTFENIWHALEALIRLQEA